MARLKLPQQYNQQPFRHVPVVLHGRWQKLCTTRISIVIDVRAGVGFIEQTQLAVPRNQHTLHTT